MNELGMGIVFSLKDAFSGPADQMLGKFRELEGASDRVAQQFEVAASRMKLGLAAMGAGLALLAPVGYGIKLASEAEQVEIAFTTMLGSAERARFFMEELAQFAAKTPFELPGLQQSAKQLMAFGFQVEEILPTMTNLGNIASGVGMDKLPNLIYALGQVRAATRLTGQDLMQFTNAGVPLLGTVAEIIGKSAAETKDLMSKGAISFEIVQAAINKLGGEGGKFYNLMENQSRSFGGLMSNMRDQFGLAMTEVGKVFLPIAKQVVEVLISMVTQLRAFAQTGFGKAVFLTVGILGALLVTVGSLVFALNAARMATLFLGNQFLRMGQQAVFAAFAQQGMIAGLRAMAVAGWMAIKPLLPIILIVGAIVGAFYLLYKALNSNNELLVRLGVAFAVLLGPIGWVIGGVIALVRGFNEFKQIMSGDLAPQGGIIGFFQALGGIIYSIIEVFQTATSEGFTMSEELYNALERMGILEFALGLATWIVRIKEFFRGLWEGVTEVWQVIKTVFAAIWNVFQPIVKQFEKWGWTMGRNRSSMETWKAVGKALAYIIGGTLVPAVAVLSAAFGALLTIGTAVYKMFVFLVTGAVWMGSKLMEWGGDLIDWFGDLISAFADWGERIVTAIWDGIKSGWSWLVDGLKSLIESLPGGRFLLAGIEATSAYVAGSPVANMNQNMVAAERQLTENRVSGRVPTIIQQQGEAPVVNVVPQVQIELDGDKVYRSMSNRMNREEAFSGN